MNRIKGYFQETYNELVYKVSWPSWEELQSSAVVVLIASLIIAMIVFVMDKASNSVLGTFYRLFE